MSYNKKVSTQVKEKTSIFASLKIFFDLSLHFPKFIFSYSFLSYISAAPKKKRLFEGEPLSKVALIQNNMSIAFTQVNS